VQGRRILLLYSTAGIAASLGMLSFSLATTPPIIGLSYTSFFSFFVFFSLGLGPVTWLIPAEIFPVRLRARAISLGTVLNRLTSGAIASTFLTLTEAMTFQGYYFFFALVNCGTFLFVWYLVPETKGRTLEEMNELFRGELPGDVARRRLFGGKLPTKADERDSASGGGAAATSGSSQGAKGAETKSSLIERRHKANQK